MSCFAITLGLSLLATPAPAREVRLTAQRVLHDTQHERTTAEGQAALTSEGLAVDAERITYDQRQDVVTAVGHVLVRLAQGQLVSMTADVITLRFSAGQLTEVFIHEGTAVSRKGTTAEALLAANTAEKLAAAGTPAISLQGNHLVRDGSVWRVEQLALVPCDCDVTKPTWSIRSSAATVDLQEERASVVGPTIYVGTVPILWLPWLSIPLTDRQTGLLFPKPDFRPGFGLALEQPVYVTLGRSADLTLTPGVFTGPLGARPADGTGWAGPRLGVELRYTPATTIQGRAAFALLYDFLERRDAVLPSRFLTGSQRGLRGEASWQHTQDFGGGFSARVDAQVHSDGFYNRDGTIDVVARGAGYLRSSAALAHRGPHHLVVLDTVLRQDIQWGYDLFGRHQQLSPSTPARGPSTLQRLPALTLTVPTLKLVGPLSFDLNASVVRLAPLSGSTGDEGVLANEGRAFLGGNELTAECLRARLFVPFDDPSLPACGLSALDKLGLADGVFQPGEREARSRLDVLPRLGLGGSLFGVASARAWAAWRQDVWLSEATGKVSQRGHPVLGAQLDTLVERDFGGLVHQVRPTLVVRAVPVVLGQTDVAPHDEVDRAVPDGQPRVQGAVELSQRLLAGARGRRAEAARLDLGQGLDLLHGRLAESYARLAVELPALWARGQVRASLPQGRVTRLTAGLGLRLGDRFAAFAEYENLLDDGTQRARQPVDLLFGDPVPAGASSRPQLLRAGLQGKAGPLDLRYEALLLGKPWRAGGPLELTPAQHQLAVGVSPSCDCWRIDATFVQQFDLRPNTYALYVSNPLSVGLTVSVSRFGTFGR